MWRIVVIYIHVDDNTVKSANLWHNQTFFLIRKYRHFSSIGGKIERNLLRISQIQCQTHHFLYDFGDSNKVFMSVIRPDFYDFGISSSTAYDLKKRAKQLRLS